MRKVDPAAPHAVLLVLDATVGQNALNQVEIFGKTAGVTGLVMTKLDGTARGGILVAIAARFGCRSIFHRRRGGGRRSCRLYGARFFTRHRWAGFLKQRKNQRNYNGRQETTQSHPQAGARHRAVVLFFAANSKFGIYAATGSSWSRC